METSQLRKRMPVTALTDPKIVWPAIGSAFAKLDPRAMMKNPVMFVVEVVAALTTVIFIREWLSGSEHLGFTFQIIVWLWITVLFANFAEAVAEGRGKAQAASLRQTREETKAKLIVDGKDLVVPTPAGELKPGQVVLVEAGDLIPSDGEVIEGVASVNEAAITGKSAPVIREVRRRQVCRDRRHARGLRLAQGAHHRRPRLDLPRPHDQAGRGRRAPEDAERDRAQYPARRHDADLRLRHGDDPKLRRLCRRHDLNRCRRGAVRHSHSDDHRCAPVGHRHRRHGPASPLQRARHVRPRRRSGRRRRYASARQDRHHHPRQPAGDSLRPRERREREGISGRSTACFARRRDAGRPLDRSAGQGEIRHPRPRHQRARRQVYPLHRAEPDERRRDQRHVDPQGRDRRGARLPQVFQDGQRPPPPRARPRSAPSSSGRSTPSPRVSPSPAARRLPSPRTASCSASSSSRTSSRAASASASPSSAAWASAPS